MATQSQSPYSLIRIGFVFDETDNISKRLLYVLGGNNNKLRHLALPQVGLGCEKLEVEAVIDTFKLLSTDNFHNLSHLDVSVYHIDNRQLFCDILSVLPKKIKISVTAMVLYTPHLTFDTFNTVIDNNPHIHSAQCVQGICPSLYTH